MQDRLLTYGANSYTYTANGELASVTTASVIPAQAGIQTAYTYDALGNLTKVALPDGRVLEYIVDGANRRIAKKVDGIITKGFLYKGSLRIAAELDGAGAVVSRFVYATGVNVPEYMVRGGATYRIVTDHLGSVRMVVDVATGAVAQELRYDEFGVVELDTNPGFTPFGFAGGLYDTDTKLVRFGARDYDAETGRWTAKDPIGFNGGDTNLYGYVLGDPVNFVDPSGEVVIVDDVVIIGALTAGTITVAYLQSPQGQVFLAQNTKGVQKIIDSLIDRALEHAQKCNSAPPDDPNQDKWRQEVKAFLDKAKRLAEKRLPGKAADKAIEVIEAIQNSI